jgi:hypothetical protein
MRKLAFFALVATLATVCTPLFPASSARISDLKKEAQKFKNEVVTVEGFVTQYVEDLKTTSFYYLKDDWGGIIKIRTSQGKPNVGARYRVEGPFTIDDRFGTDPFISEESRTQLAETPPQPPPLVKEGGDKTTPWWHWRPSFNHGLALTALLLLVVTAIVVVAVVVAPRGTRRQSGGETQGSTVKIQVPPPGTLKLLPGRFEVVKGDPTLQEIRFYQPKGRNNAEITFGRSKGPAFTHIQLSSMTVSSRQAKLFFDSGQPKLVNYAGPQSNPTQVNGKEMDVNESVTLQPQDEITMGEVVFRYHQQ